SPASLPLPSFALFCAAAASDALSAGPKRAAAFAFATMRSPASLTKFHTPMAISQLTFDGTERRVRHDSFLRWRERSNNSGRSARAGSRSDPARAGCVGLGASDRR